MSLLQIAGLQVAYATTAGGGGPQAVRQADLVLHREETLAIVGESGSGKTTVANAIMGLLPRTATVAGTIRLDRTELTGLSARAWRHVRGARIGYIPQDPMTSLNEVQSIGRHFRQTIQAHGLDRDQPWRELAGQRLHEVGLTEADRVLGQYPHQLSGGMRQRVLIALAVLARPQVIVADEPTSALDVSVQAKVLEVFVRLQHQMGFACLFITHDLAVVDLLADRIAVMKAGRLVELGTREQVLRQPREQYTRDLIAAVPLPDPVAQRERQRARRAV